MSDKVCMKALDTMHVSNVSAHNLNEGDVFLVTEADAKRLEDAGLAERGGTAAKAVNADNSSHPDLRPDTRDEIDAERGEFKAIGVAPANKAERAAPANKASAKASRKK